MKIFMKNQDKIIQNMQILAYVHKTKRVSDAGIHCNVIVNDNSLGEDV